MPSTVKFIKLPYIGNGFIYCFLRCGTNYGHKLAVCYKHFKIKPCRAVNLLFADHIRIFSSTYGIEKSLSDSDGNL